MKQTKLTLLISLILLSYVKVMATGLAPTTVGAYYSGLKLVGNQIIFTGAGSADNDSQNGGYTPRWEWDFQYNGSSFVVRSNTTSTLAGWTYNTRGTYTVAVRYWDNDNQCGNTYTFTVKVAELETLYYVKDHLGNIRVTVDNQSAIRGTDSYDPYGLQLDGQSTNTANDNPKYKYSGKELDKENGFNCYYFGARYYDPAIGRWLAVDPLADKYPGWSSYNYCADNPLKFVDPDGKVIDDYTAKLDGTIEVARNDNKYDSFSIEKRGGGIQHLFDIDKNEKGLMQLPRLGQFEVKEEDGSVSSFGWTTYTPDEKRFMSGKAVAALCGVLYETGIKDVSIGNFSEFDGGSPSPSKSHKNGMNGDIRPLRTDNKNQGVTVNNIKFDWKRNTSLIKSMQKYGWKSILSYRNAQGELVPGTKNYDSKHADHFHLQGFNPNIEE